MGVGHLAADGVGHGLHGHEMVTPLAVDRKKNARFVLY